MKSFYRSPASEARKIIVREIECAVEEKDIIVREIECAVEEKAIARMIGLIKGMAQIAQLPIETEAKGVLLGVNQECRRDLVVLEHHQRARLTLLGRNLKLIVARLPVHT